VCRKQDPASAVWPIGCGPCGHHRQTGDPYPRHGLGTLSQRFLPRVLFSPSSTTLAATQCRTVAPCPRFQSGGDWIRLRDQQGSTSNVTAFRKRCGEVTQALRLPNYPIVRSLHQLRSNICWVTVPVSAEEQSASATAPLNLTLNHRDCLRPGLNTSSRCCDVHHRIWAPPNFYLNHGSAFPQGRVRLGWRERDLDYGGHRRHRLPIFYGFVRQWHLGSHPKLPESQHTVIQHTSRRHALASCIVTRIARPQPVTWVSSMVLDLRLASGLASGIGSRGSRTFDQRPLSAHRFSLFYATHFLRQTTPKLHRGARTTDPCEPSLTTAG